MVIVINGTIGVGKTWIARTLFSQFDRAFCIDGDALGFISSDLLSLMSREQVIFQAAPHQINFPAKKFSVQPNKRRIVAASPPISTSPKTPFSL